jgi:3-phosphoshikimate 1-carboxyvinyltransferase
MQTLTLPPTAALTGTVTIPGSKSISNRALLLAAMAEGQTRITNLLDSDDVSFMLAALDRLGVRIEPAEDAHVVHGRGGPLVARDVSLELNLGLAGTALRPLAAALTTGRGRFVLDGTSRMRERPVAPLVDGLRQLGAVIDYLSEDGYPPIRVTGTGLNGGRVTMRGDLSSQFLTSLLMSAPLAAGPVVVDIEGEQVSKPYLAITVHLMAQFGVTVEHRDFQHFEIQPATYRSPATLLVEGDASSATYFLAAGAIAGPGVTVFGIGSDSVQGDVAFVDVLTAMGAEGTTTIRNIYNWRVKETDRLAAMSTELRKLGATVVEGIDFISITPPKALTPATIETYGDHRMAMCFALACLGAVPVTIQDPDCVAKTFPSYFEAFEALRTG